jgi:hypothetical protein
MLQVFLRITDPDWPSVRICSATAQLLEDGEIALARKMGWEEKDSATARGWGRARPSSGAGNPLRALLLWSGNPERVRFALPTLPSLFVRLVMGGVFYGNRNRQVVQRQQGVRFHHP